MEKLIDGCTQSSSLSFAWLKLIQIRVKVIGLLVLSIISFQTQGDIELLHKYKAYGEKIHFGKYQLLFCPSDHYQLSASAETFLLLLYKIRMFIIAARLTVVINRSKPISVKSFNHFVPVWTIGHQSCNDCSVPANMKNQSISRARQEDERCEDVQLKNSGWDPAWNEGIWH